METVQNEKQANKQKTPKVKKDKRRELVTWKTKRVGDNQQTAIAAQ